MKPLITIDESYSYAASAIQHHTSNMQKNKVCL